jgi:hypothetical protein
MGHGERTKFDANVSPNWKSPAVQARKAGMPLSDKIWHWLVSLGGLAVIALGVAWMAFIPYFKKIGVLLIAGGIAVFFLGFPSQAERNGYRSL